MYKQKKEGNNSHVHEVLSTSSILNLYMFSFFFFIHNCYKFSTYWFLLLVLFALTYFIFILGSTFDFEFIRDFNFVWYFARCWIIWILLAIADLFVDYCLEGYFIFATYVLSSLTIVLHSKRPFSSCDMSSKAYYRDTFSYEYLYFSLRIWVTLVYEYWVLEYIWAYCQLKL